MFTKSKFIIALVIAGVFAFSAGSKPSKVFAAAYNVYSPSPFVEVTCLVDDSNCKYSGSVSFENVSGQMLFETTYWTTGSNIQYLSTSQGYTSGQTVIDWPTVVEPDHTISTLVTMSNPGIVGDFTGRLYIDGKVCNRNVTPWDCVFYGGNYFEIRMHVVAASTPTPSPTATPSPSPSASPVVTPTLTPSPSPSPTMTPSPAPSPSTSPGSQTSGGTGSPSEDSSSGQDYSDNSSAFTSETANTSNGSTDVASESKEENQSIVSQTAKKLGSVFSNTLGKITVSSNEETEFSKNTQQINVSSTTGEQNEQADVSPTNEAGLPVGVFVNSVIASGVYALFSGKDVSVIAFKILMKVFLHNWIDL